uniref:Reverse transcriptase zinc-binding domain-containing protein n=1 Tax=Triticum urartu TaxID=4572 RepID=A0A8R7R329_TRIUA
MHVTVWKSWAPPKCKFFAWLVMQNRVWTVGRLARRGWPNCGLCPLCMQTGESSTHLLCHCRFSVRVWCDIVQWLGLQDVIPTEWSTATSVKDWWLQIAQSRAPSRSAMTSLLMLVSWEIWKERNARVFRNSATPTAVLVRNIKEEVKLWVMAGAKNLGVVMPRE